jgi:phosphate-selective porin OprO/OprP
VSRIAWKSLFMVLWLVISAGDLAGARQESSTYDDIWGMATWYQNDDNPTIQNFLFTGRFQYEYATVEDEGASHDEWNVRRMRLGVVSGLLHALTLHVEAEFNPQEADPFYTRLTDAYLEWSRSSRLALTIGKQGVPFTVDGSTSSKELLTIDRSNLANNLWFPQEYMPGLSISGEDSGWVYHGGVYSSGEANREFGEFDGSGFILGVVGYDLGQRIGMDRALLRGSFLYQDSDPLNTFTRQLEHVTSANLLLEDGRWGARVDWSLGSGYLGQSDLWGATLMPFVDVTRGLQLVSRLTRVSSSDPNGVRLARYENQLQSGRGNRYDELYLGTNYYFYEHKLKLQGGIQWGHLRDVARDGGAYSGVSGALGLRLSW